ncbi:hypothetical protein ACLIA0_11940 [Bacillaceae bacterium W0354]
MNLKTFIIGMLIGYLISMLIVYFILDYFSLGFAVGTLSGIGIFTVIVSILRKRRK